MAMNQAEYQALDAVNWSALKGMRLSPLHYRHALTTKREDTSALMMGRAVHSAVFEPDRLPLDYAVYLGPVRRGKEWDKFKEANSTRTILTVDEYERACEIRDAVRLHPLIKSILSEGKAEHVITWTDPQTSVACKARLDWAQTRRVVDLKTSRHATDVRQFGGDAWRLGYFHQLAHYASGWAVTHGLQFTDVTGCIISVESAPPYDVAIYEVSEESMVSAHEEVEELLRALTRCRQLNAWPGRHLAPVKLDIPYWAYPSAEEIEASEPEWMKH